MQTTHVLHFLITFLTCGLWALVWIVLTLQHRSYNARAFQAHQQAMARYEYDMWMWEEARRRGPT